MSSRPGVISATGLIILAKDLVTFGPSLQTTVAYAQSWSNLCWVATLVLLAFIHHLCISSWQKELVVVCCCIFLHTDTTLHLFRWGYCIRPSSN
jgi:hypothetical protein